MSFEAKHQIVSTVISEAQLKALQFEETKGEKAANKATAAIIGCDADDVEAFAVIHDQQKQLVTEPSSHNTYVEVEKFVPVIRFKVHIAGISPLEGGTAQRAAFDAKCAEKAKQAGSDSATKEKAELEATIKNAQERISQLS